MIDDVILSSAEKLLKYQREASGITICDKLIERVDVKVVVW